jgi:phospholipid/cholesterol/gamma-HCH transport system substrate-binding protein
VADQFTWLLDHAGDDLSKVVSNTLGVARVAQPRTDALQQLLVAFPMVNAIGPTLAPDGRGHLGFVVDFYDPPPCTKGYEGTPVRGADDFRPAKPINGVHCAEPKGSPINVRGAQNAPSPGH